jgi:3-deoxy-D-manno-octulosonic-acid transferase
MNKRNETLLLKYPSYPKLKSVFSSLPRSKNFIFGNVWPEDIFLLQALPHEQKCLLVPHKLDEPIIKEITNRLSSLNLPFHILSDDTSPDSEAQIFILLKKGILCEFYAEFSKAYVGGGFGESIHSILEPLVAGCDGISCGPINDRSTEFDIAESLQKITVVRSCQEFQFWLSQDFAQTGVHDKLKTYFESYPEYRKDLLSC